jgi:hypothetical protein
MTESPAPGATLTRKASSLSLPETRLFDALLMAAIILLFAVSPLLFDYVGLHYSIPGGNPLEKIHPGTLVLLVTLALAIIRQGNPVAYLDEIIKHHKGTAFFALTWLLLLLYILLVRKLPFTPIIDSFFLPVMAFLVYLGMSSRRHRILALVLHGIIFLNALIGLYEFAAGSIRLIPHSAAAREVFDGDWRSFALFGHPLTNATLTGAYLLVLTFGGGRDLPFFLRPAIFLTCLTALIAFGGRTSLLLTIMLLGLTALVRFGTILSGRKMQLRNFAFIAIAIPVLAIGLVYLFETGFFSHLANRFANDDGSTLTRIQMFDILSRFSLKDLFFGPDLLLLKTLQNSEILSGFESFIIAFVLYYGLAISIVFFAGLVTFCYDMMRQLYGGALVPLLFFFTVAATSLSLGAKTPMFGMLVIMLMVLQQRPSPLPVSGRYRASPSGAGAFSRTASEHRY